VKTNKIIILLIAVLISFFLYLNSQLLIEELISIGMFIYFFLSLIDSIGKEADMMGISVLLAIFQCLLMPAIVYHVYNDDAVVQIYNYGMLSSPEFYYGFMLPAIIAYAIGLNINLVFDKKQTQKYKLAISQCKHYLEGKSNIGLTLLIIGLLSGFLNPIVPEALKYVSYLVAKLIFVGLAYIYFSDSRLKKYYLLGGFLLLFIQALAAGMFGELIYTFTLSGMLILLGRKINTLLKMTITVVGVVFIVTLQSIKADYRKELWTGALEDDNASGTFITLFVDKILKPKDLVNWKMLFPVVNRFNQGMIVDKVLDYIPSKAPFAEGETIFKSLAASFVPRILWPDKPKAGGHYNVERFIGVKIQGYSMNISPMGEAYGNFGVQGGIAFMFFYGLFFSIVIIVLLNMLKKRPTLVLWFPVLFLNSIQMETDVLMCINSIIKNLLFITFCYWAAYRFMRVRI
jgi:hypothetical protein